MGAPYGIRRYGTSLHGKRRPARDVCPSTSGSCGNWPEIGAWVRSRHARHRRVPIRAMSGPRVPVRACWPSGAARGERLLLTHLKRLTTGRRGCASEQWLCSFDMSIGSPPGSVDAGALQRSAYNGNTVLTWPSLMRSSAASGSFWNRHEPLARGPALDRTAPA